MTTPDFDLAGVLPYGVTMEGDGTTKPVPAVKHPKVIGDNLRVPVGPSRVFASWSGPQEVNLGVYRPSVGTVIIGTIPAGKGTRSIVVPYGAKNADESAFLSSPSGTLPAGTRGTLEVYPMPS